MLACLLAADGMTAARTILEARRGFFAAAGGGYDPAKIAGRLGAPFFLQEPGISIKPYPSGSLSQAPTSMEARGALGIEVQIGPAKLRAEAGAARLFDARMWLFDLTGAIALALQ